MSVSLRTRRMTRLGPVSQEAGALCVLLLTQLPGEEEFLAQLDSFHVQLEAIGEMTDLTPSQLFQTSVISALVYSLDYCLQIVPPSAAISAHGPVGAALRRSVAALSRFWRRFSSGPYHHHRVVREWERLLRVLWDRSSGGSSVEEGPPFCDSSYVSERSWSDRSW